ncbi:MAG: DUF2516 family protein [Corynebacterium glucuronolyticum]|nr:DUF2516 family protein [Corynebacterium glucuronolyticum]MDD7586460.1 DUF2516 family protein [Mycobacteriaceae bacterium]MDY5833670.1 DUF2516 family protein [Corynebacterium glucuronolyticum]
MVTAFTVFHYVIQALFYAIALAGIIGLVQCLITREDAFPAADRKSKMTWVAILAGSTLAQFLYQIPLIGWIGMVAIGIYWFDVRPSIKDVLSY